jgi:tRNA uridine 5-carboxymethylaminomethyl modification enzyme
MTELAKNQGTTLPRQVDAVVVGGGHAGIEAAWALARIGHQVAMITFDSAAIGRMSCNPSIGGLAKGQLVREIDALGGLMGRLIDRAGIHFRMLNRRKGPAVHAPRAQADKDQYCVEALSELRALENLTIIEAEVTELICESAAGKRQVTGLRLAPPDFSLVSKGGAHSTGPQRSSTPPAGVIRLTETAEIASQVVVLTVGTFLKGKLFTGMDASFGGRRGEPPAEGLSKSLMTLDLQLGRLKTGTPPRLDRSTIDFFKVTKQEGHSPIPRFSYFEKVTPRNQVDCYITRTSAATHGIISANIDRSPLFSGMIKGIGPRYCPSIEDKIVSFPDRESHQIFLEPEGLKAKTIYPNGISTSLPLDVQEAFVRSIPGLEQAEIVHPGYAVEYDFLLTSQIDSTLQVRGIGGLFASGQLNGTSGYEEAAAQGIVAGLNASALISGAPPFTPARDQAYIGVLIDDLVTKVPTEPYRMFTSQSEYRLMLRQDNADHRLSAIGFEYGLLAKSDWQQVAERWDRVAKIETSLAKTSLKREQWNAYRKEASPGNKTLISEKDLGTPLAQLLKRPGITMATMAALGFPEPVSLADGETIEAEIKYAGYIAKQERHISRIKSMEETTLPDWLFEMPPESLSREAREKLLVHRPATLGQALRIPGITQSDGFIISIMIRSRGRRKGSDST